MTLKARCQNCMTGIVLLNLFKYLADRESQRRGFAKGFCWIAPQTHSNLIVVAKGCIAMCLSWNQPGSPWSAGHCRCTELPIEEYFGRLRSQSSNAQMNVRSFWKFEARELHRVNRVNQREKKPGAVDVKDMPALSEKEFLEASQQALKSGVRLAAWCADADYDSLMSIYQNSDHGSFQVDSEAPLHHWEDDELDADAENKSKEQDCQGMLQEVRCMVEELNDEEAPDTGIELGTDQEIDGDDDSGGVSGAASRKENLDEEVGQ